VKLIEVPPDSCAVQLYRIASENLIACEPVTFARGAAGVDTVLRRASISGRVEIGGKIADHFADLLNTDGDMLETVALDAASYRALKTRWMRTRVIRYQ
jgi:hypothetical protein